MQVLSLNQILNTQEDENINNDLLTSIIELDNETTIVGDTTLYLNKVESYLYSPYHRK